MFPSFKPDGVTEKIIDLFQSKPKILFEIVNDVTPPTPLIFESAKLTFGNYMVYFNIKFLQVMLY